MSPRSHDVAQLGILVGGKQGGLSYCSFTPELQRRRCVSYFLRSPSLNDGGSIVVLVAPWKQARFKVVIRLRHAAYLFQMPSILVFCIGRSFPQLDDA